MDIGNAIIHLRKEKGYSQKNFALKCGISVNALCQIESNSSFPKRSTLDKMCEVLEIPISYLLFFSISNEDIPAEKVKIFNSLKSTISDLLLEK